MTQHSSRLLGVLVVAMIVLAGCGWGTPPAMRTVDFSADEVTQVEIYMYEYMSEQAMVELAVITDPEAVEDLVEYYTDLELGIPDQEQLAQQIAGQPAAGMRFILTDGATFEVTQVRGVDAAVIIFWPDQDPWVARSGIDHHSLIGSTDQVDASEVPPAELP
ncbi:MAG: hypothetical protein ACK5H2_07380 [Beutenbergiaceae bacterium]